MTQHNDTHILDFVAGEALQRYRRVKLNGSTAREVVYADAGEDAIGVTRATVADEAPVGVLTLNKPGTVPMIANGAITVNALVYPAADGKVTATVTGRAVGRALSAASADTDLIEVLPILNDLFSDRAGVTGVFDDFFGNTATTGQFIVTADAGSTGGQALADGVGGVFAVYTDGDNDDEAYLHTAVEAFKFAADKPLWFEARVAPTDSATNVGNFIVGMLDAAGANALLDSEGGPPASYSGAVFYKVSGSLVWSAECSIAGTQTAIALSGAGVTYTVGTYYKLGIEFIPYSSTQAILNLYIDGLLVGTNPTFTFTSATEMDLIVGAKSAGAGGTAEELILVDYINCRQVR